MMNQQSHQSRQMFQVIGYKLRLLCLYLEYAAATNDEPAAPVSKQPTTTDDEPAAAKR